MKNIIIIVVVLIGMSCTTQRKYVNFTLYEAIGDIEDYVTWLGEDLTQGRIDQEQYDIMLENYLQTIDYLHAVYNAQNQ